ncbi:MAG: helix-turn-helix domain-containing protein, partial [Casimicrobium sp.]
MATTPARTLKKSAKAATTAKAAKTPARKRLASDRHPLTIAFGEYLKAVRIECGKSQMEFAFDTTLDRTYISLLERGYSTPTLLALDVLARGLNRSMGQLIAGFEAQLPASLKKPAKPVKRRKNEQSLAAK